MSIITVQTPAPTLVSIEGEIIAIDGTAVTIRFKKPRRQMKSQKTVSPFVMVTGEVGGIGTVHYFSSESNFDLEGEIDGIEDGIATISGPVPALINTKLVAIHADVEKVEDKPVKKKKSKSDDDSEEKPGKKKKKKKKFKN